MALRSKRSVLLILLAWPSACAEPLPDDVENYREECLKMNCEPIGVTKDDPHDGEKDVFACNLSEDELLRTLDGAPFPDGTLIVKESTRRDSDYPWLIATARKRGNDWKWDEYTKNFEDEEFLHILSGESVCTDCHKKVSYRDWIFTVYQPPDDCDG